MSEADECWAPNPEWDKRVAIESAERAIVDAADKWDEAGGPWLMPDRMVVDNLVQAICAWRKLKGM